MSKYLFLFSVAAMDPKIQELKTLGSCLVFAWYIMAHMQICARVFLVGGLEHEFSCSIYWE
jgi:hypothetical protein